MAVVMPMAVMMPRGYGSDAWGLRTGPCSLVSWDRAHKDNTAGGEDGGGLCPTPQPGRDSATWGSGWRAQGRLGPTAGLRRPRREHQIGGAASRELLWAQVCFTHIEAGSRSSDGETQGAFLFYGPEDLEKKEACRTGGPERWQVGTGPRNTPLRPGGAGRSADGLAGWGETET